MKVRIVIIKIIAAILALSMFVAMGDNDYYYYILLRERVFFYGIIMGLLLLIDIERIRDVKAILLGLIIAILLWNPISPASLDRGLWELLNLGYGAFFAYVTLKYGNASFTPQ